MRQVKMSKPKLSDLKEIEMKDMSSFGKEEVVTVKRVVKICGNCQMVYINEQPRILCLYCGNFYDAKTEREKNRSFKSTKILKNRKNMNDTSCNEDTQNFEETEYNSLSQNDANPSGVRNFIKSVFKKSTKRSDLSSYSNEINNQTLRNYRPKKIVYVEESKLVELHRFLTINNKNFSLFADYRKKIEHIKSIEEFRNHMKKSITENRLEDVTDFFCWIFSKSSNILDLLVTEKNGSKLKITASKAELRKYDVTYHVNTNWRLMKEIYMYLLKLPKSIVDLVVTSISFCIANDLKPIREKLKEIDSRKTKTDEKPDETYIECLTELIHINSIYLCNPLLKKYECYTLFSLVLGEIANLGNHLQHSLILAMRRIPLNLFREILSQIQSFLSSNLDSGTVKSSPLPGDWMTSAVKVMAILHCTNEMQINYHHQHYTQYSNDNIKRQNSVIFSGSENKLVSGSKIINSSSTSSSLFISYKEFYIEQLNNIGLYKEYLKWQKIGSSEHGFSFCQYPFLLSLAAKRDILEQDSEQQMILIAKKSYINRAKTRREAPKSGDLFLMVKVNRNNIVSDSMNEIQRKSADLKKKLRLEFIGEAAIDMGGVRKEWFLLLVRQIFNPLYGMFELMKESNVYWFTTQGMEAEYNLIGVVMGLAVYNSEILDIHFPPCVYKKLLPSSMNQINDPKALVGIVSSLGLYDLKYIYPVQAQSLQNLLDYEGDVQEDFMLKFEASYTEFDVVKLVELKENGKNIDLTNANRKEYVDLYVDFLLNKSIYKQFAAFYHGFHSVCASNAVILLRPEEIESLVCGSTEPINISELRNITVYDGYTQKDNVIDWFWTILKDEFNAEEQKRLLLFTTGSDRIPIDGIKGMSFKITRIESKNQLPMSHTCFNQLVLPNYKTKEMLKEKLTIAIENAEGFGFK